MCVREREREREIEQPRNKFLIQFKGTATERKTDSSSTEPNLPSSLFVVVVAAAAVVIVIAAAAVIVVNSSGLYRSVPSFDFVALTGLSFLHTSITLSPA